MQGKLTWPDLLQTTDGGKFVQVCLPVDDTELITNPGHKT